MKRWTHYVWGDPAARNELERFYQRELLKLKNSGLLGVPVQAVKLGVHKVGKVASRMFLPPVARRVLQDRRLRVFKSVLRPIAYWWLVEKAASLIGLDALETAVRGSEFGADEKRAMLRVARILRPQMEDYQLERALNGLDRSYVRFDGPRGNVGSFKSPRTGGTVYVMAKRGESPSSARARVSARHFDGPSLGAGGGAALPGGFEPPDLVLPEPAVPTAALPPPPPPPPVHVDPWENLAGAAGGSAIRIGGALGLNVPIAVAQSAWDIGKAVIELISGDDEPPVPPPPPPPLDLPDPQKVEEAIAKLEQQKKEEAEFEREWQKQVAKEKARLEAEASNKGRKCFVLRGDAAPAAVHLSSCPIIQNVQASALIEVSCDVVAATAESNRYCMPCPYCRESEYVAAVMNGEQVSPGDLVPSGMFKPVMQQLRSDYPEVPWDDFVTRTAQNRMDA